MARPFAVRFSLLRRGSRVAAVGLAFASASLAASCRDVVTDDVIDAQAALCSSFDACSVDASACDRVTAFFGGSDDEVFTGYLEYYREWSCGEGCGSVEACLDYGGLCLGKGEACAQDFECCDASTGAAACKDEGCCFDLGVLCEGAEDCCSLGDGTAVGCFRRHPDAPKTCGGFAECALRDEPCEGDDDDCCGKATCRGGRCVVQTCVERDAPCRTGDDCCVEDDACDGTCKPKDSSCDEDPQQPRCCTDQNLPCTPDGTPCCGGAMCSKTLTGETLCGGTQCGPLGSDCLTDADCCANGTDDIHCLGVGSDDGGQRICQAIDCQIALDAPCSPVLPCCSGLSCLPADDGGTTCQEVCAPKACHDVRSFGPPLDTDLGCDLPAEQVDCAATVCEADPFCCCTLWDETCVDAAYACLGDNAPDPGSEN